MRTLIIFGATMFCFFGLETLVFHTGFYASILNPDSTSGFTQIYLRNEKARVRADRNQIVAVGDSRMGFFPRFPNELKPGLGYTFASIAIPGSTPRAWYYALHDIDPQANRYAAVLIPLEDYDDAEIWENLSNRESDLNYLISVLGWRDIREFANSYEDPDMRMKAIRGLILKGLVYKRDFQDFLLHPAARLAYVDLSRRESHNWFYGYVGTPNSMQDYRIDWAARKLITPQGVPPATQKEYEDRFLGPQPPQQGRHSAYLHYWLGKIRDHYRGSGTRLVFLRLPRAPFIRPDQPPFNPHSVPRDFAAADPAHVVVIPEHALDDLEKPELFMDPYHLNGPGQQQFSLELAKEAVALLGPPRA